MRPLPRLLAFTDQRIAALDDFGIRAAAIAAVGPAAGLVARLPGGTAEALTALAQRCVALAIPPEAVVLVTGRADVASAVGTAGVILRHDDLDNRDARATFGTRSLLILRSVHSVREAEAAAGDGTHGLILGPIWETATHPGAAGVGLQLLELVVALGLPTFAIGGVTTSRAAEVCTAGAWGVAAISAAWDSDDPYASARALVAPWQASNSGGS